MQERHQGLLLIGVLVVVSFVFQLQMKLLANQIAPLLAGQNGSAAERFPALLRMAFTWRPLFIGLLALTLFAVWLLALTRLELSLALPLASVALVVNAVGSGILLGETLTLTRTLGVVTVAVGTWLVLRS